MARSFFIAAAAFAALSVIGTGAAQAETLKVSTQGLDLSTPAGAKAFYSRLSHAVIDACGGAPTNFFASDEERFQACYKTAMDQAVTQARAPLVAQLYAGKRIEPAARLAAR